MAQELTMWWKTNPTLFLEEQNGISKSYPSLTFFQENGRISLRGPLYIADIASFEIEIIFPDNYPELLPEVKEISNKIPVTADRHINSDGTCCLSVPAAMHMSLGQNYDAVDFIKKFVEPFFANQLYYEIHGTWRNGDYSHGNRGILECYEEILNIKGLFTVVRMLNKALQALPNIRQKCPCGSGKPLRKCHLDQFIKIKKSIPHSTLRQDYQTLANYLK